MIRLVPAEAEFLPREPTALAVCLRAARLAAGLTGPEVKSMTGIDPGSLSGMEQGRRAPSLAILLALAGLYRVPFAALVEAAAADGAEAPEALSPHLPVAAFVVAPDPASLELHERHWQQRPDLRANARRFATDVFEPVQATLGVELRVESGYRSPTLDREVLRGQAPFSAHTHGLAADVTPGAMPVRSALHLLRSAVRRGDLRHLDFAAVESSRWLHLQAAPDSQPARQVIAPMFAG
jgi:transcriptional regulator with XRE-family HTH domain